MADLVIDITGIHCPMTFVKTKLAMANLEPGERLEVVLRDGEPLENVPRAAETEGHRIIQIEMIREGIYRLILEKGGTT